MDNNESIKQQMSDDEKWDALQAEAEAELELQQESLKQPLRHGDYFSVGKCRYKCIAARRRNNTFVIKQVDADAVVGK